MIYEDLSSRIKQRNVTIDIVRALGIIMVPIAHVIYGGEGLIYLHLKGFLYSGFLVCLFFVLGGFLIAQEIKKYSLKQFLINKTNRLFVPSIAYTLFYIVSNFLVYGVLILFGKHAFFPHTTLKSIALSNVFLAIVMSNDARFIAAGIFGALYFMPAYFTANILFFWFLRLQKGIAIYIGLFFAPLLAITITRIFGYANIPWGINIALLMIPMMCLGVIYDKIEAVLEWVRKNYASLLIIGIICAIIILNHFKLFGGTVHNCNINNIFSFYGLSILGFFLYLGVALFIKNSFVANIFLTIGKYTLPIYGFHIFILDFYRILLTRFMYRMRLQAYLNQHPWFFYVIYVVLSIALIIFISKTVIEKNRLLRRLFLGVN